MGTRGSTCTSDLTDLLSFLDLLTLAYGYLTSMTIQGNDAVAVGDHAVVAVSGSAGILALNRGTDIDYRSAVCSADSGTVCCSGTCDIDSGMEPYRAVYGVCPVSVFGSDGPACYRPCQRS